MFTELRFNRFRLPVRLGWSEQERRVPQPVDVSFVVRFVSPVGACETDDLAHTLCYARVAEALREYCDGHSFNLIEALAARLYRVVRQQLAADARLRLEVTKVSPPITGLAGGVTFVYGDETW